VDLENNMSYNIDMIREGWIYEIRCIINNRVYIGSSLDYKNRISNHINKLNKGNHRNEHLNRAWKKYGQNNFRFSVIEYFPKITHEKLREIEQTWLDCITDKFNISTSSRCPYLGTDHFKKMHKASKEASSMEWLITNPDGIEIKIKSLRNFCNENNLQVSSMHKVAQGKRSHHKKWKCRYINDNEPRYVSNKGMYYLIEKDGKQSIVRNLSNFMRVNNLIKKNVYKVIDTDKYYQGYKIKSLGN
jgi:group I intron endonuclease